MTATNKTTSDEEDAGPLDGTEELRLAIAGSNYKTTTQAIADLAPAAVTYNPPLVTAYNTTAHTLVRADAPAVSLNQGILPLTNAAPITLTVPQDSDVTFPSGTIIQVVQMGVGQVTVAQASGTSVVSAASLTTRAQFSTLVLTKMAAGSWVLSGDMT